MNIAYSCNDYYIPHTGISMISLFENNKDVEDITIYFIAKDISKESENELIKIAQSYNRKIVIIPFEEIAGNLNISSVGRHIETVYAKLFFGNIKDVDKIIYLDSDVIINGSLKPMWDINLEDNYFGCVKVPTKDYCKELGLSETEDFYNDGVVIVNAKALRENNKEKDFLEFIKLHNGNPPVLSEGTINVVAKDRIKTIPPKFNVSSVFFMFPNNKDIRILALQKDTYYSNEELDEARNAPVVIHYLSGWYLRPWEEKCTHPLKYLYEKYKAASAWKDLSLQKKELPLKMRMLRLLSGILPISIIVSFRKFMEKL